MQSGFGLLEAGSCSPGFEVNIMMKNIVDVVFTALSYYLVGYGISFGEPSTPFMGMGSMPADGGYEEVTSGLIYSQYIFQLSFAATSTTIVSGCVAMRLRFFVYILYSLLAVIFYAFVAHWVFADNGWLKEMGAVDFAGGAPVHVFGGINGLVATLFLGPRTGRFDGTRPITDFIPSSPSSQCLGLLVLWWGKFDLKFKYKTQCFFFNSNEISNVLLFQKDGLVSTVGVVLASPINDGLLLSGAQLLQSTLLLEGGSCLYFTHSGGLRVDLSYLSM